MPETPASLTATLPDIRANAARFVSTWTGERRERAEKDTFWNEFFEIFGVSRRRVGAVFEFTARRYSSGNTGFMDLFWPRYIAVEHKSRGADLGAAMEQLVDYLPSLPETDLPAMLVVCDFDEFIVRDVDNGLADRFRLEDLPTRIEQFAFLAGHRRHTVTEDAVEANLEATQLLADLHDRLAAFGYPAHDLRILLTRLLYVLFADDTALWSRHLFDDYLNVHTAPDGSDLGSRLNDLFELLDTAPEQRMSNLTSTLREFPYVNGGLFSEHLRSWAGDTAIRDALVRASAFEWSRISPAIFGSLFQDVMDPQSRRALGAHYTSERDIMRAIRPLFLDELEEDLARAKTANTGRLNRLREYQRRLASLTFFDPACGCGNFLLLTFRELRRLELETLLAIRETDRNLDATAQVLDIESLVQVNAGQFYGIEVEEFPARIAETAMHLVDHFANRQLSAAFGSYFVRLPITATAHMTIGDALATDWSTVLPAGQCDYLLSNPPFVGISLRSASQTAALEQVWGPSYHGSLDYVTGWYAKAATYIGTGATRVAFVSTNSISQGEQVAPLWRPLLRDGFQIDFAHRTFAWTSEASGRAAVHVVIIGFSQTLGRRRKTLFTYPSINAEPVANDVANISPYLIEGPSIVVETRSTPLAALPEVAYGNKPTDGGNLIVEPEDYSAFSGDPIAEKYLRRYIGARELLHGGHRWCLWLVDLEPGDLGRSALLRQRVEAVRQFRLASKAATTRASARDAALFRQLAQPVTRYVGIPIHVSETREFFPVGYFEPDVIASNANFVAPDPTGLLFAVMSSAMFMAWFRTVGGRIKSDLRFSKGGVWNTLPLPTLAENERQALVDAGAAVMAARDRYPTSSLAQLYEPNGIPTPLRKAHTDLDRIIDRLIAGRRRIASTEDRVRVLFERYITATQADQLATTAGTR